MGLALEHERRAELFVGRVAVLVDMRAVVLNIPLDFASCPFGLSVAPNHCRATTGSQNDGHQPLSSSEFPIYLRVYPVYGLRYCINSTNWELGSLSIE